MPGWARKPGVPALDLETGSTARSEEESARSAGSEAQAPAPPGSGKGSLFSQGWVHAGPVALTLIRRPEGSERINLLPELKPTQLEVSHWDRGLLFIDAPSLAQFLSKGDKPGPYGSTVVLSVTYSAES